MNKFIIALLTALVMAQPLAASTNSVKRELRDTTAGPNPDDPVEKEYQKLLADDDAAQTEVDKWIQDNEQFAAKGAGMPAADLSKRIRDRFEPINKAYESFLKRHPNHARGHIAYASFLGDLKDEEGAEHELEVALPLDPKNPAIYNNLANIYGHISPVKKAFEYYQKAIDLESNEPVYYQNFGTTVYLFRQDAREYYGITEQQVFDKALDLYSKAMKLAPDDFPLASDVAQTYYGIQPRRTNDALVAWTNALNIAHDEVEREGVYIHLARIKLLAGRFAEARAHLNAVTNEMYTTLKNRVMRNVNEAEAKAKGTNTPAEKR